MASDAQEDQSSCKEMPFMKLVQQNLQQSLEHNKKLLKRDSGGKFENNCASFLMAGSIGVFTIEALNNIQELSKLPSTNEQEKSTKLQKGLALCKFINQKILFAAAHCLDDINEPEDEILYGTAGYL